jgi:hypothetical protein
MRQLILSVFARMFFLAALAYLVLSLLFYAVPGRLYTHAFPLVRGMRMLPPFADLRWVTSLSECGIDLQELADKRISGCDPYGRDRSGGLGYPPMSIQIARLLHVRERHTELFAVATGLSMGTILIAQVRRLVILPVLRDLFMGLLLLSFPMQLALERSNIDVVIFLLLTSLSATLASKAAWTAPAAAAIAWAMVAIKVYPFVGILGWLAQSLLWRPRLDWLRVGAVVGAMAGLASALPWLLHHGEGAAQPGAGPISHAFLVSIPYFHHPSVSTPIALRLLHSLAQPLLGLLLFVYAVSVSLKANLSDRWTQVLDQGSVGFERRFFQIFPSLLGCVWLGCYFLSSSFDYRLILALPAYVACFALRVSLRNGWTRIRLLLDFIIYGLSAAFLAPLLIVAVLPPPWGVIGEALDKVCDLLILPMFAGVITSLMIPSTGVISRRIRDASRPW